MEKFFDQYLRHTLAEFHSLQRVGQEAIERIQRRVTNYLESDDFESDLDRFAGMVGLVFTEQVAHTEDRELRVKNKGKAVLARCREDLKKTTVFASGIGSVLGRANMLRLVTITGSVHVAFLFVSALYILVDRLEQQRAEAAEAEFSPPDLLH